jgi:hypothetical protein
MLPVDDRAIALLKQIFVVIFVIAVLLSLVLLFSGCSTKVNGRYLNCDPEKAVVSYHPFRSNPNIILKGYDENCDHKIDYWQHYDRGEPFGRQIRVQRD